ncbi:hypothetical protein LCL95_04280 [Bacillus timonensis]|nr:hypothetical protein [Bacillus timonensis]
MKILLPIFSLLAILPFLLSFDSIAYQSNYYAKYQSPEGIAFLSYTEKWDEDKLKDLYLELLNNQHGEELKLLQEVRVMSGELVGSSGTKGQYHALTNTITLFHGDIYTSPSMMRETLSHEYGHHVGYYYLPSHHFPNSTWAQLRGLETEHVSWDAFWRYSTERHERYPQEIFADDYVLLFGPTSSFDEKDAWSNEAFYLRTQQANQEIPNVLELTDLHHYLEKITGFEVSRNRIMMTPKMESFHHNQLTYKISKKPQVSYRLNVHFIATDEYLEAITIFEEEMKDHLQFSFHHLLQDASINGYSGPVVVNIDVVDLTTSFGFQTEKTCLSLENNEIKRYCSE